MEIVETLKYGVLSLIVILFFWFIQSVIILKLTRRYVFSILYRHKVTEFLLAQPSIMIHEISHFFAAIFTGSFVSETLISSKGGRVTTLSSESIGGWISRVIAAFSPIFQPIFLLILLALFFGYTLKVEEVKEIFEENVFSIVQYLFKMLITLLNRIVNFTSITDFFVSIVFIYLFVIFSISASPSEEDWKAGLEVLFSPISSISLFIAFIFLYTIFAFFNIHLFIPIIILSIFNFIIAMFGIFLSIFTCSFIRSLYFNKTFFLFALVIFSFSYLTLEILLQPIENVNIISFLCSAILSTLILQLMVK